VHYIDIIFFALVAVFLALRLRSVLGKRTGNENPPSDPFGPSKPREAENGNVVQLPGRGTRSEPLNPENAGEAAEPLTPLDAELARIAELDPRFSKAGFIEGAKAAFEMIIGAFDAGDVKTLRPLLSDEVYEPFAAAIKAREAAGEKQETELVGFKKVEIEAARLEDRHAFVTVRFATEQVNVLRDKDGKPVEGDPQRINQVVDLWTFSRDTRSRDPNWVLIETGTPE
jgi:predicted lipid-binding transport protein (Tim44 family)